MSHGLPKIGDLFSGEANEVAATVNFIESILSKNKLKYN